MDERATVGDTRVTGLFGDLEQARMAVRELIGAGFADGGWAGFGAKLRM